MVEVNGTLSASTESAMISGFGDSAEFLNIEFGGMSGGPVFQKFDDEHVKLVGIMFRGSGPADQKCESLDSNKSYFTIRAFPLDKSVFETILNEGTRS